MQNVMTEIEDTCNGGCICSRSEGEKVSPVLDDGVGNLTYGW
jgi:hypothetical protein